MKLSEASINSVVIDNNTKINGEPIEWYVAAQNTDGAGITTLMMKNPLNISFDVKEPTNPNSNIQEYGNADYEKSNILQWLNSNEVDWYTAQHEYDQAPNSAEVGDTYANSAGFLCGFSDVLFNSLQSVEKMGVTRKVHLPGLNEITGIKYTTPPTKDVPVISTSSFDLNAYYPNFRPNYATYDNKSNAVVRTSSKSQRIGVLRYYSPSNSSYSGANVSSVSAYLKHSKTLEIPTIYVDSNLPISYSDGKYYVTFSVKTPYTDYGNHKAGFSFDVRVTSGESGNATVKVSIDNTLTKTVTVTPNTDATITLSDSDVSGLAEATHTVGIEATQGDFTANTSFTYTKTSESTPVIMAEDIGLFAYLYVQGGGGYSFPYPLTVSFQVYDEDQDNINVRIEASEAYRDHKFTVYEENNVPQNTTISYTLTDEQLENAISNNDDTKIIITASNGSFYDEGAVTVTIPFEKTIIPSVNMEGSFAPEWLIDNRNSYQDILHDVNAYGNCSLAYNIFWSADAIDKPKTEALIDGYKLPISTDPSYTDPYSQVIAVIAEEGDLPFFEKLSGGTHTLTVNCYNTHGYKGTISHEFTYIGTPKIEVDNNLGEHSSEFVFDFSVTGINDSASIIAYIDDNIFYQLNYATDGRYSVKVNDSVMTSIGGGSHTIRFTLTDKLDKTATASTTFSKLANKPIVFMANNLGDRTATFTVTYVIKNAYSEHPSLKAYMDSKNESNVIADIADASTTNHFTLSAAKFADLSEGSHTIITVVTNTAGSTTVNTAFNVVKSGDLHSGLKLGYEDDTWDGTTYPNRIYEQNTVIHNDQEYQTFIDRTPYDTEGESVTGGMLAMLSRGIQNALSANVIVNSDGSLTETSANGTTTLTKTDDGYIEVYTDKDNNTITKQVFFNVDGTIAESTSYVKGE